MIISFTDTAIAFKNTGNKSYNLAKAVDLGLNVPRYVCITPKDCINNTINPETFKRLKRILLSNFQEGTLFAVRPSINTFDKNLFGQFASYMNVPLDRLDEYIDECLASINTKRVQSYINRNKTIRKVEINVIVQEMVSQKLCGVMFTSNPIGIISENMIVAGSGDCNQILENKSNLNTYYYNTTDTQSYWIINDENSLLNGDNLRDIYSILDKVKKFYSKPIRLDFSIQNNIVYILQTQELNTFSLDNVITLCSADMMLYYKDINLPLNISFVKECYSSILSNLIYHLTNSKEIVEKNKQIFDDVICIYNGYPYYNLNNLYEVFSLVPLSKEIENVIQDELPLMYKILNTLNMIKALCTSSQKLEEIQTSFEQVKKIVNEFDFNELSDIQLKTLYKIILNKTIDKWDISIINSVYCYLNENSFKKHKENSTIDDIILDISTENGVAGVIQQQILLSLSGKNIPKEISLQLYEYIQNIFIHIGINLVNLDCLQTKEDVYYLTVNELFNEQLHSYKDIVLQRKINYNFYHKLPRYTQISFDGSVINKVAPKNGTII